MTSLLKKAEGGTVSGSALRFIENEAFAAVDDIIVSAGNRLGFGRAGALLDQLRNYQYHAYGIQPRPAICLRDIHSRKTNPGHANFLANSWVIRCSSVKRIDCSF